MHDFCPLCMKSGVRSKIKIFQINLEEAVWSCEKKECIWPIGYQNLEFFQRLAISCDWEESGIKEYIPVSMELSLYTPPVTPRGETIEQSVNPIMEDKLSEPHPKSEYINMIKEVTDYNKLCELESNNFAEANINKILHKTVNTIKSNNYITTTSQDIEDLKTQKTNLLVDSSVLNTTEELNTLFNNTTYYESSLHMQCESKNWQNKCEPLSNTTNHLNANFKSGAETNINLENNVDITNISSNNMLNNSTSSSVNTNCSSIDIMLDHILNNENSITKDINDDWLDMLQL